MNITSIASPNVPDHSHNKTAQHWSSLSTLPCIFWDMFSRKENVTLLAARMSTQAFYRHYLPKKKGLVSFLVTFLDSLIGHTTQLRVNRSAVELSWIGLGNHGWSSLIGWKQALSLGMLQNGIVAEVVLVWGLNAEGSLCSHASHRLAHI